MGLIVRDAPKRGMLQQSAIDEIYYVICDSHDHVNYKYPILKMPRPVAHVVGYVVHGLGFYHIPRPPLPKAKKDSKAVVISVEGGKLTKEEVQRQPERIFPRK